MNKKIKQKTTSDNFKTLLFGALIAAMILPFSSMSLAEANTGNNPQIISELNGKCLDIEGANQDNL